jgi:hypothetical protein
VICRDNLCTFPLIPPEVSEQELSDMIGGMVDELLTPEGMAQFFAEEGIEDSPSVALLAFKKVKAFDKLLTFVVKRGLARRSATVSFAGAAPMVTRGVVTTAIKNLSNQATRAVVKAVAQKMGAIATSGPFAVLFFTLQAVGMVLDIDDAAGFNAQVPQSGVDMYMKKMLATINEIPELKDVGVQFPREYLPEHTIEYRSKLYGDVSNEKRTDLMLDYVDHLDINSNGNTIIRDWSRTPSSLATPPPVKNSTLWKLAGKNEKVYAALSKWWWLILVLSVVVVVTIGLGVGLTARKRRRSK